MGHKRDDREFDPAGKILCLSPVSPFPEDPAEQRSHHKSEPEGMGRAAVVEPLAVAIAQGAKQDVEIGGVQLKAGEVATLLIGAANLDEGHFESAGTVDFERERNIHLAFGGGPHRCLGSHLARMELQVSMEEWHRRIPEYRIADGETPRYSPGIREVLYLPLVWDPKQAA